MHEAARSPLRVRLLGLDLASPVILAAGTAGVLDETAGVLDLSRVGAVVTKSITPEPRAGNPPMRVAPVRGGMLNAIGLANPGIDRFMAEVEPRAGNMPCAVIASAAGFSIDDYVQVTGAFGQSRNLAAVELNVSCPNVHGGVEFGADRAALTELVQAVKGGLGAKPLLVKLPPVPLGTPVGIVDLARAAIEAGADALTLCNTLPAMGIDVESRQPMLGNVTGGLSGPAVHAMVTRLVHLVYRAVAKDAHVPIVGLGGVINWQDAAEFVLAGASAVGVGTAMFAGPRRPVKLLRGLEQWVRRQGARQIGELVGSVET